MKYAVTSEPAFEPLGMEEVKLYLRTICDDTSEDVAIIQPLIVAARTFCENATGRSLAPQTITAYMDSFSTVRLPRPPFISVASITYTDRDGNETEYTDYTVDPIDGIVYFKSVPNVELSEINPIKITYRAGYESLPMPLRQAMLLLISHWYTNREAVQVGSRINEVAVDFAFQNLIHHYKVWWF